MHPISIFYTTEHFVNIIIQMYPLCIMIFVSTSMTEFLYSLCQLRLIAYLYSFQNIRVALLKKTRLCLLSKASLIFYFFFILSFGFDFDSKFHINSKCVMVNIESSFNIWTSVLRFLQSFSSSKQTRLTQSSINLGFNLDLQGV